MHRLAALVCDSEVTRQLRTQLFLQSYLWPFFFCVDVNYSGKVGDSASAGLFATKPPCVEFMVEYIICLWLHASHATFNPTVVPFSSSLRSDWIELKNGKCLYLSHDAEISRSEAEICKKYAQGDGGRTRLGLNEKQSCNNNQQFQYLVP